MPILPVNGIRIGSAAAGIRYKERDDLVVIECRSGTNSAAVFTRNRFSAAPIQIARNHLAQASPRALLINSGNANAGTGEQGLQNASLCCQMLADELNCKALEVLPFSTGVIGEQLPLQAFKQALPACVDNLSSDADAWSRASKAIMTTDTVPKLSSRKFDVGSSDVTITGMSKGAGMIRPDMATMLAYVATDAVIEQSALQQLLTEATGVSFNRITVDGDTSTNDACTLLASGAVKMAPVETNSTEYDQFLAGLTELMQELAQAIIRDAEGATKFVTLTVDTAPDLETARAIAFTVARSPLVKTALFASDPNWGRLLAAIGRSPVKALDISKLSLSLGDTALIEGGEPVATYTEAKGQQEMNKEEITIRISLNAGDA
ncbi:MAG: bifunctional glutamate N-acetyltransferase/amino-acid acetyltransferase ArgJ, partial [Gammaproteobacteria bacterium]|nr:bifunctional glutamate N-acetyltransferase/amino-acid acetyltransferase ArgJ [Gammaproteobacteria bacterium]MDX2487593.1 bifunctional glutamate N-acetyltransferase/amino-acid acetyltransferase ArgJ [Gammaproteobacteria bacterium]